MFLNAFLLRKDEHSPTTLKDSLITEEIDQEITEI